jgi:hypothetical protein
MTWTQAREFDEQYAIGAFREQVIESYIKREMYTGGWERF